MNSIGKISYLGIKPSISFYNNIPIDEYNLINNEWDAKKETLIYLENDCVVLYQVLLMFLSEVNDRYGIDTLKVPTLPSMSMQVFRTCHYNPEKEPITSQNAVIDSNIRKAYYGGAVDVYSPIQNNGYLYDVNSLYPQAMTYDLPIGPTKINYWGNRFYFFILFFGGQLLAQWVPHLE